MSQATTASSQFPTTSNGPSSLPSASPVGGGAQNQFNDVMKGRLAPSPSAFSLQSQLNSVSGAGSTTSVGTRLSSSGTDSMMTTSHVSAAGPTSVSSSKGGSPAPATPAVSSPNTANSLGKFASKCIKTSVTTSLGGGDRFLTHPPQEGRELVSCREQCQSPCIQTSYFQILKKKIILNIFSYKNS